MRDQLLEMGNTHPGPPNQQGAADVTSKPKTIDPLDPPRANNPNHASNAAVAMDPDLNAFNPPADPTDIAGARQHFEYACPTHGITVGFEGPANVARHFLCPFCGEELTAQPS